MLSDRNGWMFCVSIHAISRWSVLWRPTNYHSLAGLGDAPTWCESHARSCEECELQERTRHHGSSGRDPSARILTWVSTKRRFGDMQSPFPGMDPYLEHPALWPDVHNRLIVALDDDLTDRVAPRYYVGLERRTHLLKADDLVFVGRPDPAVAPTVETPALAPQLARTSTLMLGVDAPMQDEIAENFLEIHEVKTRKLITIVELLSPVNKLHKSHPPRPVSAGSFRSPTGQYPGTCSAPF
jgi:Protein of unknown function (DUF4058)